MATPYDTLNASNGNGEAVRATVTTVRAISSTIINVDSVTNWPAKFIATTAKLNVDGTLDPTTIQVFSGELVGVTIQIDSFAPGYTDKGNSAGDIVVIKPTTLWADQVAAAAQSMSTFTQTQGDWRVLAPVPTLNASNGQREYQLKFANTDLTTTLQAGTKLKIPRTSTAPTQSAAFVAASSQYATKTAPTTITPASAFTIETWANLNSYAGSMAMVSLNNSTDNNGIALFINSSGQVRGYYGTGPNFTEFVSYQSVPLKRNVHIAYVVSSISGKTGALYIDGVSVPFSTPTTTATSVSYTGVNLRLGAYGGAPGAYYDGTMNETRIWQEGRTAQQIRDNMNKQLVGNETNLVAYFKLNGNFNDSTANANNLTASGGAIATNASNPMNATEYAIVTSVTKPAADTLVTVFLPTGTGLPNETLGAVSYSVARTPFGFPASSARWTVGAYLLVALANTYTAGQIYNMLAVSIPTGAFKVTLSGTLSYTVSSGTTGALQISIADTNSSISNYNAFSYHVSNVSNIDQGVPFTITKPLDNAAMTTQYINGKSQNSGINMQIRGDFTMTQFVAECAYL